PSSFRGSGRRPSTWCCSGRFRSWHSPSPPPWYSMRWRRSWIGRGNDQRREPQQAVRGDDGRRRRVHGDRAQLDHRDRGHLRRRIGYAIQGHGLFPHRTVAENIATVPRLLGWDEARIRARVEELLLVFQLDPGAYAGAFPHQLSGGQQQRVGVARALAAEPAVLLMDEPSGALDPIIRAKAQDDLLDIQRRFGTTIVLVTHDMDEAFRLGDHVAVMS